MGSLDIVLTKASQKFQKCHQTHDDDGGNNRRAGAGKSEGGEASGGARDVMEIYL
jgi:hypothetical protein